MNTLCIYHGGCDDGFGAAWAMRQAVEAELYPGAYQRDPPWDKIDGREVYLVDFSYKRPVMEEMARRARRVIVLDHHETAKDDLAPLLESGLISGQFDLSRSGSVMTWDWFHDSRNRPPLLEFIQDRDLWRKALPDCDLVIMALRSYPQDMATWDNLMAAEIAFLRDEGRAIHRYYRTLVDEAKRRAQYRTIGGEFVPTVNVPHYLASEVAGELFGQSADGDMPPSPFGACYWRSADGTWTFSLRSRGECHVGRFAERFGGGGHAGAAGFRVERLADLGDGW